MRRWSLHKDFEGYGLCSLGGGGGGGSQPTSSTVTNKSEPPSYLRPYITDIATLAQGAYGDVSKTPYSGELVAKPTDLQTSAQNRTLSLIPSLEAAGTSIGNLAGDTLSGKYLNFGSNPYLAPSVAASTDNVTRQLLNQALPQVTGDATFAGAYGGARERALTSQTIQDAVRNAQNIAVQTAFANYNQERQNQLNSPALIGQAISYAGAPASIEQSVGSQQQLQAQDILNEQYQKYLLAQSAPFLGLPEYSSLLYGQPGGVQTGATNYGYQSPSTASNIFNGLLGAGGLALGAQQLGLFGAGGLGGLLGIGGGAAAAATPTLSSILAATGPAAFLL